MRKMMLALAALAAAGCDRNHTPTVVLVEPPGLVFAGGSTRFTFRVNDADGDPLRVRLDGVRGGRWLGRHHWRGVPPPGHRGARPVPRARRRRFRRPRECG